MFFWGELAPRKYKFKVIQSILTFSMVSMNFLNDLNIYIFLNNLNVLGAWTQGSQLGTPRILKLYQINS